MNATPQATNYLVSLILIGICSFFVSVSPMILWVLNISHAPPPLSSAASSPSRSLPSHSSLNQLNNSESVSTGKKIRKWFFLCVVLANGSRSLGALVELLVYGILVSARQLSEEVMHYKDEYSFVTFLVMICRTIPSIAYIASYSTLSIYLASMHYALLGKNFSRIRLVWIVLNVFLLILLITFLFLFPCTQMVYGILFTLYMVMLVTFAWYCRIISTHFSNNSPSSSSSSSNYSGNFIVPGGFTNSVNRRIVHRFYLISGISLSALSLGAVFHLVQLIVFDDIKYFYTKSLIQFYFELFFEVFATFLLLCVLSNWALRFELATSWADLFQERTDNTQSIPNSQTGVDEESPILSRQRIFENPSVVPVEPSFSALKSNIHSPLRNGIRNGNANGFGSPKTHPTEREALLSSDHNKLKKSYS